MKLNRILYKDMLKAFGYVFSLGIAIAILSSCSKKKDNEPVLDGQTYLSVQINGISGDGSTTKVLRASSENTGQKGEIDETEEIVAKKIYSNSSFDVQVSMVGRKKNIITDDSLKTGASNEGYLNQENGMSTKAISQSRINGLKAASTPMPAGRSYRLLIYNDTDINFQNPVVNQEAISGTRPSILIDAGKSYRWFAFSLNEATAVPAIVNGVVPRDALRNKDILMASGTINTVFGQNVLEVNFDRLTSKIQLTIDARGLSGSMKNLTTNISSTVFNDLENGAGDNILRYGDLNIFTRNYSNIGTFPITGTAVPAQNNQDRVWVYTLYTIDNRTIASNDLKLSTGPIQIDRRSPYQSMLVNYAASTLGFDNNAFTLSRGSQYDLSINFIEKGVKVNGLVWSRMNMAYHSYGLQFTGTPTGYMGPSPIVGTNFSINYLFGPTQQTGFSPATTDPCKEIFPKNTWRLPTSAEVGGLIDLFNAGQYQALSQFSVLGNDGYVGIEFPRDSDDPIRNEYPARAQNLFFPLWGLRYRTEDGANVVALSDKNPIRGYYWVKDAGNVVKVLRISTGYQGGVFLPWTIDMVDPTENHAVRCVRM